MMLRFRASGARREMRWRKIEGFGAADTAWMGIGGFSGWCFGMGVVVPEDGMFGVFSILDGGCGINTHQLARGRHGGVSRYPEMSDWGQWDCRELRGNVVEYW